MIKVNTMGKQLLALNIDMIERIESIPETMLTLTNGKKIIVTETMDEVIEKIKVYQASIFKCNFKS